jgi:ribosomal protein S11
MRFVAHRIFLLRSRPGELVFGVARIFASFNDTFVHVTDLRFVNTYKSPAP